VVYTYLYDEGGQWERYDNRVDRGCPPTVWTPANKIYFVTFISNSENKKFSKWCKKNCDGRYFSPKTWWFMFEFTSDLVKFIKEFSLQLPIEYPIANKLKQPEIHVVGISSFIDCRIESMDEIYDWVFDNSAHEWGIGKKHVEGESFFPQHGVHYFSFSDPVDAAQCVLRWG